MSLAVKKPRTSRAMPLPSGNNLSNQDRILESMCDLIARKAYEIWEQRGRQEGKALEDWLEAERIVRERRHDQVSA